MTRPLKITGLILCSIIIALATYYCYPEPKFPNDETIDRIVVLKSKRQLLAYGHGHLLKTYRVSIGSGPPGPKEYEGDHRTPEGIYHICAKNPNSGYYKNLGISYPGAADIKHAHELGKSTGGDVKIHGLKNGRGYIGRFHRLRNWTAGCIALTNEEVDELYEHTPVGIVIEIRP